MAYFSEIKYLGGGALDFIEVVVPAGTDVSNIEVVVYHPNGSVRTVNAVGTLVDTQYGQDIYVIDVATSGTFTGIHQNGAVALVVDGVVEQFVSFKKVVSPTTGPAAGMSSTQIGTTGNGESLETTDGGLTYQVQTSPGSGSIPCFAEGTLILTERGEVPVENLGPGDRVATRDHGYQPLRWVGSRIVNVGLLRGACYDPVRIPRHAFGFGAPHRDLEVSPNHKLMVRGYECELLFGEREVLVPAKVFIGVHGIEQVSRMDRFRYFHLALDRHEVLISNGLESESLLVTDATVNLVGDAGYADLRRAMPDTFQNAARLAVRMFEARTLVAELGADRLPMAA